MNERLATPADLAEILNVEEAQILEWRRAHGWPSIKVGKTIRFTEQHVEQILAKHTTAPKRAGAAKPTGIPGQTKRSARRAS